MIEVCKTTGRRLANIRSVSKALANETDLQQTIEVVVMSETGRNRFVYGWSRAVQTADGSWMIANHTGRLETRWNETYESVLASLRRWAKTVTDKKLMQRDYKFDAEMLTELMTEWGRFFEPRPINWHIAFTLDLPQMRVQMVMDCNGDLSDDTEHKMQFDSRAEMYEFAYNFASNFEANNSGEDTVRTTHEWGHIAGDVKPRPYRKMVDEISWNNLIARRPNFSDF